MAEVNNFYLGDKRFENAYSNVPGAEAVYYSTGGTPPEKQNEQVNPMPNIDFSDPPPMPPSTSSSLVNANVPFPHNSSPSKNTRERFECKEVSSMKSSASISKPSEALFVRALIGRCKRIAPLWFRGVSSMRERNREENRRMASNNGQSQNDWRIIGLKIAEMNSAAETDAVVNLLKKLYKELPADSVFWFLKCFLGSEDSIQDPDLCVISRGDAKGRMRRIDGGKGSDKVWRLDTIVGMLYHGLPMSSTDTNIMVHTCDHELCVRPQHIRFRASSVALVVVLKALAQAGYTVTPPKTPAGPTGIAENAPDESVDVFGPFSIKELQQYRTENLKPAEESICKLTLNTADHDFADSVPVIRSALQYMASLAPFSALKSRANGFLSLPNRLKPDPEFSHSSYHHQPHVHSVLSESLSPRSALSSSELIAPSSPASLVPQSLGRMPMNSFKSSLDNSNISSNTDLDVKPLVMPVYSNSFTSSSTSSCLSSSPNSSFLPAIPVNSANSKQERKSLKRHAPDDSSCSFPPSPARICQSNLAPASSPPTLISERTSAPEPSCRLTSLRLSDSNIHTPIVIQNPPGMPRLTADGNTTQSNVGASESLCNGLTGEHSDVYLSSQNQQQQQSASSSSGLGNHPPNPQLIQPPNVHQSMFSTAPTPPSVTILHQPYVMQQQQQQQCHPSQLAKPVSLSNIPPYPPSQTAPLASGIQMTLSGNSTNSMPLGGSASGKSTPRQPAKKRPEARTPTGGGKLSSHNSNLMETDGSSGGVLSNVNGANGAMTFRVHQNTPFIPVHARSGRPSSTGSDSSVGCASGLVSSAASTRQASTSDAGDSELSLLVQSARQNGAALSNTTTRLPRHSDEEEAEMDQELMDIMVGRSGVGANAGAGNPSTSLDTNKSGQSGQTPVTSTTRSYLRTDQPDVGTSPSSRRIIEAIVASLANAQGSPMQENYGSMNPRRSASACSLPRVGNSPNDDLADILFNSSFTPNTSRLFSSPNGNPTPTGNSNSSHLLAMKSCASWNTVSSQRPIADSRNTEKKPDVLRPAQISTPSPLLISSNPSQCRGRGMGLGPPVANGTPVVTCMSDNAAPNTTDSMHDLANLIRNSPASGISQELIDMLANMSQQYGVHQPRSGSRASRPSSQVAQHFYRSLVNGSMCGSPFPGLGMSSGSGGTLVTTPTNSTNSQASGAQINNWLSASMGNEQSVGLPHPLYTFSFTPLSVESDLNQNPYQTHSAIETKPEWQSSSADSTTTTLAPPPLLSPVTYAPAQTTVPPQ